MKITTKMEGFDELQRSLEDAEVALKALRGRLGEIRCNPEDPKDVRRAVADMERLVDSRITRYRDNPLVAQVLEAMKSNYRERILQQVEEVRKTADIRSDDR
jgi:hypothetical protein